MKKPYASIQSITGIFATYLILSLVLIAGVKRSAAAGGQLNPPPGGPAPGMKSLEEIEPRILLDPTAQDTDAVVTSEPSYHFMIMKPGSYYLADDFLSKNPERS